MPVVRSRAAKSMNERQVPRLSTRASNDKHGRNPDDYSACQEFAGLGRRVNAQTIRYESARSGARGQHRVARFIGVYRPHARIEQTWHFRSEAGQMTAFAAFLADERYSFSFRQFARRNQTDRITLRGEGT